MTILEIPGLACVAPNPHDQRCPRCTRALHLDHRTTLGGVLHASCPHCQLHFLSAADIWSEFGGCQGCPAA